MPSALAVLRLITNSNLVGCSIGRSAGLAPFRILSTWVAARRYESTRSNPSDSRPPASANCLLSIIDGSRYLSARSATILGRLATRGSPGAISAPACCLVAALKAPSKSAGTRTSLGAEAFTPSVGAAASSSQDRPIGEIGRVPEDGHAREAGHDLLGQRQPLPAEVRGHDTHPRDVAARTCEARNESP